MNPGLDVVPPGIYTVELSADGPNKWSMTILEGTYKGKTLRATFPAKHRPPHLGKIDLWVTGEHCYV